MLGGDFPLGTTGSFSIQGLQKIENFPFLFCGTLSNKTFSLGIPHLNGASPD